MKTTKIIYQNYGSSILIFIYGNTPEDAYRRWMSLYNWGATESEPTHCAEKTISCWSTLEKFRKYFINMEEHAFWLNKSSLSEAEINKLAKERGEAMFASIETEGYRSVNNDFETADFGTIAAEKPDDDFKDSVLRHAFSR